MAESAARHLRRAGVSEILVTNRTRERAVAMAEDCGGRVLDYEYFEDAVPEVDIVLASSGAPHFILTRDQMRAAMGKRRNRPMFLIDIAVPRNIDPEVNELESVFLYDIDDLGKVVDDNLRGRIETAKDAEEIVREEVERMMVRLKTREVAPAIVQLQEANGNVAQGRNRAAAFQARRSDAAAGRGPGSDHARPDEQGRNTGCFRILRSAAGGE